MNKKWKQVLAQLRETYAYDGDDSLAAVKAFVEKDNIKLLDGEGDDALDLDATFAAKDADEGEGNKTKGAGVKRVLRINADLSAKGGGDGWTPKGFRASMERKAYNAKAALGKTAYPDADIAEVAGAYFRLKTVGHLDYSQKSRDLDIVQKTSLTTDNAHGGATIPEDFEAAMIDLKEARGDARALLGMWPMSRDTATVPRRTGGVTVYAPGEGGTTTASKPSTDNVKLVASKMGALAELPSELINDSAISYGDFITREIAHAFADKEDEILFNGDGTSTYFGFSGIRHAFRKVHEAGGGTWGTNNEHTAGLVVGSGNLYSELVLSDFEKCIGRLPSYADKVNPEWAMHKSFYWNTVVPLIRAAGGTDMIQLASGQLVPALYGHPVRFVPVMPSIEANSQVCALFGAYNLGARFGEVRGSMSIASSTDFNFDNDVLTIRGLQRVAFNVHDVGNYSATAASRVAGPIVGLVTANS